jgi:hypothetical protein
MFNLPSSGPSPRHQSRRVPSSEPLTAHLRWKSAETQHTAPLCPDREKGDSPGSENGGNDLERTNLDQVILAYIYIYVYYMFYITFNIYQISIYFIYIYV